MRNANIAKFQDAVRPIADPGPSDGLWGDRTSRAARLAIEMGRVKIESDTLTSTPNAPWIGAAKPMDAWDYGVIAKEIRTGEDEVRAVIEVEAAGSGFDSFGRVKMLFEPHVFYRELGPGAQRDEAVKKGLAYLRWGERSYPATSYSQFNAAALINERAAYRSASWGAGQIMGFNASLAGYDSAESMVAAFAADEENHARGMVRFILAAGLDDEIRRHDWKGFARGYNGPAYYKNAYDVKLAAAYAKWRGRPDVPPPEGV